ncbi:hypothetical protein EXS57_03620 [Candidatus Kaiserbacteria bacterium]|nr:hypothetical protein [Candidatus Kaiserbacteria bacterium]
MTELKLRRAPIIGEPGRVGDIQCFPCESDDPSLPKGARTWNHPFRVNMKAGMGRRMLAWRIKGEEVGNHFHPRAPNKDPEVFEFLYGDLDVWFKDVYGQEHTEHIRIDLGEAPVLCTVPPYVLHRLIILSEKALFEEFQEGPFDPHMNYSAAEFELIRRL